MGWRTLLREPLLHFLAVGMLLFILFEFNHSSGDAVIRINASEISAMGLLFESQWRRPATDDELATLIELRVREEIYAREASTRGLDRGDGVVRRRLAQKLENYLADLAALDEASPAQLLTYYRVHQDHYRRPAVISFEHRFYSVDIRGNQARYDAVAALLRLNRHEAVDADSFVGPTSISAPEPSLSASFGNDFSAALLSLAKTAWAGPGEAKWAGPIQSAFGEHLVRIDGFVPSYVPTFETVQQEVAEDWNRQQAADAQIKAYSEMRARYRVDVAAAPR